MDSTKAFGSGPNNLAARYGHPTRYLKYNRLLDSPLLKNIGAMESVL
jgi:hypothetical protein